MNQDTNRNDEDDPLDKYKIVLVGDTGVGKTYLMNNYVKGQAPKNNLPTIGIEFATKTITLKDGGKVKASIWDTAGQERYRGITNSHFKGAGGAIVVYDITKEKSFENLHKWIEDLKEQANSDVVIYIIANKIDLVEKNAAQRKVSTESGNSLAEKYGAFFQETSALKGTNVASSFDKLIQEMYTIKDRYNNKSIGIQLDSEQNSTCCNKCIIF